MNKDNPADRYAAFISNKRNLVSFDCRGNLSTYFFPWLDNYQNLAHSLKWIEVQGEMIQPHPADFDIAFAFNRDYDALEIAYHGSSLEFTETYWFDEQIDRLNLSVAVQKGRMDAYHCFLAWKLKASSSFHGIDCHPTHIRICKHEMALVMQAEQFDRVCIVDPHLDGPSLAQAVEAMPLGGADNDRESNLFQVDANARLLPVNWPFHEFLSSKLVLSFKLPSHGLTLSLSPQENGTPRAMGDGSKPKMSQKRFAFLPQGEGGAAESEAGDWIARTSLAVINMLQSESGAVLASYEQDEFHRRSGGYGYCWGRDAAFIIDAFRGRNPAFVFKSFDFLFAQTRPFPEIENARYLKQRHLSNGWPAPVWGDQYDESGSLLWIYAKYQRDFPDQEDLARRRPHLQALVNFLLGIVDHELGLFRPSIDIWEERHGFHLYSQLACLAGLSAATRLLRQHPDDDDSYAQVPELVAKIKGSLETNFFVNGVALRSILKPPMAVKTDFRKWCTDFLSAENQGAHPFLEEFSLSQVELARFEPFFNQGFVPDFTPDIANLALIYPFDLLELPAQAVAKNIAFAHRWLCAPELQLHHRYLDDPYMGGNPWVLATLWQGIAEAVTGDLAQARQRLVRVRQVANTLGLLPEQVDSSGAPYWIMPLGWSHAFYLILFDLLEEQGH